MRSLALASLLLLAGCATVRLHTLDPQANDFPSSLGAEYMAYSDSENEEGHFIAAHHFAAKGVRAMDGEEVDPERVSESLPDSVRVPLTSSRELLESLLTPDITGVVSQKAARAQLLFDCWTWEARYHDAATVNCQENFRAVAAELQTVADSFPNVKKESYIFSFSENRTGVSSAERATIIHIVHAVLHEKNYTITLEGHGGRNNADQTLAEKRMGNVHKLLIARGVPEAHIKSQLDDSTQAVYLSDDAPAKVSDHVDVVVRIFTEARK